MAHLPLRVALLVCSFLLGGCSLLCRQDDATAAASGRQSPGGADEAGAPVLSPDGRKLFWHVVAGGEINTLVRDLDSGETQVFRLGRTTAYWAQDSRRLIVEQDHGPGDTRILVIDTQQPKAKPVSITPWEGAKSYVLHIDGKGRITFVSNFRDIEAFDVYTADMDSMRPAMVMQNNGEIVQWVMDEDGTVGARVRRQDEHYILQVLSKKSQTWKSVHKWRQAEIVLPFRIDRDAGKALLVTNAGRAKTTTVELKLAGLGR